MSKTLKRIVSHQGAITRLSRSTLSISKRYKSETSLVGSVEWHSKHLFISVPESPSDWPSHLEKSENANFSYFSKVSKAVKVNNLEHSGKFEVKVTGFSSDNKNAEVMLFPDLVKLTSLSAETVADLFKQNISTLPQEKLTKKAYIFVCSHANRDKRCGQCGPAIFEAFEKSLIHNNLQDQVELYKCSHFGGHKWAGNAIIFDKNGGNWYGTLKEEDVPQLIEEHLVKEKILWNHWRGRTGLHKEEAESIHAKNIVS